MHDRSAISGEPTNLRPAPPTHCFLPCVIKPNFSASRTAGESVQDNALLLPEQCSVHVGTE